MPTSKCSRCTQTSRLVLLLSFAATAFRARSAFLQDFGALFVAVVDGLTQHPLNTAGATVGLGKQDAASDTPGGARIGELHAGLYSVLVRRIG